MRFTILFTICLLILTSVGSAFASDYVLPYPSYMPGHKLYRLMNLYDQLMRCWHFGKLGSLKYYRKMTDKYFVEAKILFEYKQYSLAVNSLKKTDQHYLLLANYIDKTENKSNNYDHIAEGFKEQSLKHVEIIEKLLNDIPEKILWQSEKDPPVELKLKEALLESLAVRQKRL